MLPKPYTVPTQGPVGALPGGGRPAPVAAGAHPLQGHGAGPPAARHAGVLPGRPVPGERHHRRGQAGARAAGRAGERPPHVHVRHRAGPTVSLTFDNLGEVADLERGEWPAGRAAGPARLGHARRCRGCWTLLAEAGVRATFFVEGLNAELYPDALRVDRRRGPRGRVPRLAARAVGRSVAGDGARVVRARRDRAGRARAAARRLPAAGRRADRRRRWDCCASSGSSTARRLGTRSRSATGWSCCRSAGS